MYQKLNKEWMFKGEVVAKRRIQLKQSFSQVFIIEKVW